MLTEPKTPEPEPGQTPLSQGAPPVTETEKTAPAPVPEPPAPPFTAQTVLTGDRTEQMLELQSQLELEKKSHAQTAFEKKERETRIAELEDELFRLREEPRDKPYRYRPFKL